MAGDYVLAVLALGVVGAQLVMYMLVTLLLVTTQFADSRFARCDADDNQPYCSKSQPTEDNSNSRDKAVMVAMMALTIVAYTSVKELAVWIGIIRWKWSDGGGGCSKLGPLLCLVSLSIGGLLAPIIGECTSGIGTERVMVISDQIATRSDRRHLVHVKLVDFGRPQRFVGYFHQRISGAGLSHPQRTGAGLHPSKSSKLEFVR